VLQGTTAFKNFLALSKRFLPDLGSSALRFKEEKGSRILNAIHKIIELEVLDYYSRKTREVWFNPIGNFKPYDGISQSKLYSVEVKFEAMARDTFNLCFEYEYRGAPSGLASTQAQKWVHVVPMDRSRLICYEFDVAPLRDIMKDLPLWTGGDGNKSRFKLLPVSEAEVINANKFEIKINWDQFIPYWA
jgi:hypothetical protein